MQVLALILTAQHLATPLLSLKAVNKARAWSIHIADDTMENKQKEL